MKTNKLDNQLTLITTPTNKDIIHIGAFIHTGTINEHNYPSGIAHFIEHMVFKGTVSYIVHQVPVFGLGLNLKTLIAFLIRG